MSKLHVWVEKVDHTKKVVTANLGLEKDMGLANKHFRQEYVGKRDGQCKGPEADACPEGRKNRKARGLERNEQGRWN